MRKVRTASGATAVQIVSKSGGVRRIVEHLGSAHDETEVAALLEVGRQRIAAWQGQGLLDLESLEPAPGHTGLVGATVVSKRSGLLWDVLHGVYTRLGLGDATGGDRAFEQMVLAHLIEPTSKAQVPRVLGDLGLESVSARTLLRSLGRCGQRGYREAICQALFDHVTASGGLALCLQASPPCTSRPSVRTTCARSVTPRSVGSTLRSSWACWLTGQVFQIGRAHV
mgnify:CR=1 FL=1